MSRLPPAIELRTKLPRTITDEIRRDNVGDLAYTITSANPSIARSSKKQFEIGQVLEFNTSSVPEVDPMLVSADTEIRHDTNVLDLESIDLTTEEIADIKLAAINTYKQLTIVLSGYKQDRLNTEIQINENKKSQNETIKALNAVNALIESDDSLKPVALKLEDKLRTLRSLEVELVEHANIIASQATDILDDIRKISQVIR